MTDLSSWLATAATTPDTAFDAHLRLVGIHPFNDGNGRTARLLMNLALIRAECPPIAVALKIASITSKPFSANRRPKDLKTFSASSLNAWTGH